MRTSKGADIPVPAKELWEKSYQFWLENEYFPDHKELIELTSSSETTVYRHLNNLIQKGYLRVIRPKAHGRCRDYKFLIIPESIPSIDALVVDSKVSEHHGRQTVTVQFEVELGFLSVLTAALQRPRVRIIPR